MAQAVGDLEGEARDRSNIGVIYREPEDDSKALEHHEQPLPLDENLAIAKEQLRSIYFK